MRTICAYVVVLCSLMTAAVRAEDNRFEGRVALGGVVKDETGNRSVMQRTYNIHEGFAISSLRLDGRLGSGSYLRLDVSNLNLDDRRGYAEYRIPGLLRLTSRYAQSQQVFDTERVTESTRHNFFVSTRYTPTKLLEFNADYGLHKRTGDRLAYPDGVQSNLGTTYDYVSHTGRFEVGVKTDYASGSIAVDGTRLEDREDPLGDREAAVLSANVWMPCRLYDRLTHVARGAVGKSRLPESDVELLHYSAQYTAVAEPLKGHRLKYRFYGGRVDDDATGIVTDNLIHDIDADVTFPWVSVSGGYGCEMLDDNRSITTYNNFRGSLRFQTPKKLVKASVQFAGRLKEDEEKITLLRDTETARTRARLDVQPLERLSFGGGYALRERELPDIGTEIEGWNADGYARYAFDFDTGMGEVGADLTASYKFADDEYTNLTGGFHSRSHYVTGSVECSYEGKANVGGAVTYMEIGRDLDVEKSILSFWLDYRITGRWEAAAKYNVYNYDDFIARGRYYTANIVWLDVAYNFEVR